MLGQPGAGLGTVVAGKVVSDDEEVARRIVGFDVGQQSNVVRRVARSGAADQLLAIAHAQRSIDPGFFGATTVVQRRFDAMPIGRPGRRLTGRCGELLAQVHRCRRYWQNLPFSTLLQR